MDKTGGCSPLTVTFTNATTGAASGAAYKWDFGNGNSSTLISPGATYREEKTYTVSLTVTSAGQTSTKTKELTVYKKPVVNFSADKLKGCVPLIVDFTSNSSAGDGTISSYFWDFGDGSTEPSTNTTFNHTYTFAQKATVSLTVTNSYGCFNTISKADLVNVFAELKPSFTADKTVLCKISDAVTFNNTSTGPAGITYLWDFGDGKTSTDKSPAHIYNQKGIFTVKLTISSSAGCTQTVIQTNYINVANFTTSFDVPALVCEKTNITFNNTSSPSPSSTYWEADNNGSSYSYSPNYYFATAGTYAVKLTNTFGSCRESVSKNVVVKKAPVVDGIVADLGGVCGAPVTINFKDTSKNVVKWSWNFNYPFGSNTSDVKEPSYTFNTEGFYLVGLTVSNAEGCSSTITQYVNVSKPNIAVNVLSTSGDINSGCTGLKMKFGASPANEVKDYKWDFGDGGTSTVAEPTHTFLTAGYYTVKLTYTTTAGCKGEVFNYYPISVYQKPEVDFTSLSGTVICGNTPVIFSGSVTNNTSVSDWYWTFGDNNYSYYSNNQTVSHQYFNDTVYTVMLVASNGTCRDTVIKKDYIKVLPPFPKISNAINTCDGTRGLVSFIQDSKKAISGTWNFGDGNTSPLLPNQPNANHTYTKSGAYTVVLTTVNDQCSVSDSLTTYVLLKQKPILSSLNTEICGSNNLDIKISNLDTNPYRYNYYYYPYSISAFQYGDKTPFGGNVNLTNSYWTTIFTATLYSLQNGQKDLRAILTSAYFGCSDTSNFIPMKIKGPIANFGIKQNSPCFKYPIIFSDSSRGTNNVPIELWEWSFGNGDTKNFTNNKPFGYAYNAPGYYYTNLKVTDAEGCTSVTVPYSNYVTVSGPKADFSYYPASVTPNTNVTFYNNTNNYNSYNSTYLWILPGGITSLDSYPSYTFTQLETDTVKLIATNPATGCSDTAVQVIYVKNLNASFTYATSYINNNSCPPVIVKFTNTSLNANSVSWNFGDGSRADNQNYPSHTYYNPGVYNVTIYVTGINGLTDSTTDSITVKGPYAKLKADILQGCSSLKVKVSAAVKNAVSYTWDFGDGSLQDSKDTFAIHQYTSPGVYTPAIILKDGGGCSGTSELNNKIIIDTLNVAFKTPDIICDFSQVLFMPVIQSLAADQLHQTLIYKWQFGTGNPRDTSNISQPYFSYNTPGKYPVKLKVSSPYGCIKEAVDTIQVLHTAKASIQSPAEVCAGSTANFTGSADISGLDWKWEFGNGNTSNVQSPSEQLYTDSGTVKVMLIVNNTGCYDTAINDLIVRPRPNINLTPKQANVCLGKSVQLAAGGGNVYVWRADAGLNEYSIAQPVASPAKNTIYLVEVTNAFGCKSLDSAAITVSAPFNVKLPADTSICESKELQLIASGASSYKWINNTTGLSNTSIANPVASSLVPVVYTVVGYDAYNCFSDTESVKVGVVPLPTINGGPDLQLPTGSNVILQTTASSDVVRYNWSPADYLSCTGCAAPVSTPKSDIIYIVTGITQFGCSASDTLNIKLICDQSHVYIPNAFTPNNDNNNDVFYIKGRGVKMIKFLKIFNRLGEAIFEKDNFQIEDRSSGWDGKYKGTDMGTGAYVYFTEMICDSGETFSLKGTVMVVR